MVGWRGSSPALWGTPHSSPIAPASDYLYELVQINDKIHEESEFTPFRGGRSWKFPHQRFTQRFVKPQINGSGNISVTTGNCKMWKPLAKKAGILETCKAVSRGGCMLIVDKI